MPSGPWGGVKLCEVIGDWVYLVIGNELSEVDAETSDELWTIATGNTPICWVMKSSDASALIVFNGYYEFDREDRLSNLAAYTLDGREEWRTPRPHGDDIFSNRPYFRGAELMTGSWNGFCCTIHEASGEITGRRFTK